MAGLEPAPSEWRSGVRPLHHTRVEAVGPGGLEPPFSVCKTGVFPLDDGPMRQWDPPGSNRSLLGFSQARTPRLR